MSIEPEIASTGTLGSGPGPSGAPPEGLWLPDQGVQPYRGRG